MFELEGLRAYNDRFGFAAGDALLRNFAVNLVSSVAPLGGTAYGEVAIPGEAQDAELALRIAGQRLAAHKQRQHRSARDRRMLY